MTWTLNWTGLYSSPYYNRTVGFSSVLFGYKVVSHYYHTAPSSLCNLFLPS